MRKGLSEKRLSSVFEACIREKVLGGRYPMFDRIQKEMPCQQGIPDIVAASAQPVQHQGGQAGSVSSALSRPSSAMLLSLLKPASPRSEAYLRQVTKLSPSTFRKAISDLQEAALVETTATGTYIQSPRVSEIQIDLWAFEVKVEDWQRALYQALQYQAFAHRVVVVYPERWIQRIEKQAARFRKLSIGVVAVDDENESCRIVVTPKKNRPRSRRHYLYALGRFLA